MITIIIDDSEKVAGKKSLYVSFPYNNEILGIIKTFQNRHYHPDEQSWELPSARLTQLLNRLSNHDIKIMGETYNNELTLPKGFNFKTKPFDHQTEGFEFGLGMERFILGDDQGLGKTKQVIDIAVALKPKYKHCLIITAINGLKWNWDKEIKIHSAETGHILGKRWMPKAKRWKIGSGKDKLNDLENLPNDYFLVTNVETLRQSARVDKLDRKGNPTGAKKTIYPMQEKLKELCDNGTIGIVAIDEIHKCKNPTSQQGKAILQLAPERRIALSGTPLMNSPLDLFIILHWLGYEEHNFHQFKKHYCIYGGMGNDVVGFKNLSQLREMLSNVMLRRLKTEVLDLPDKIRTTEYIEMGKKQEKIYYDVLEKVKEDIDRIKLSPMPLAELIRLRQATGYTGILSSSIQESAKFDRLDELIEEIAANGNKALVFSNWTDVTNPAIERLARFNPAVMTGDIKDTDRTEQERKFMEDDDCKVIVGTIGAMGTGYTLTAGTYVIFLDEPWNRALKDQAEDRAHRIGTTGTVNIITLICKDTLDERINDIVMKKGEMADMLVDGNASSNMGLLLDYIMK